MNGSFHRPTVKASIKAALLMTVTLPVLVFSPVDAQTCSGAGLCNGDFEIVTPVAGTDAVAFAGWISSDPAGLRAGVGASASGNSAEFLFSTNTLSQALATGLGDRYEITFQYKSEGGQGLSAYFGDARIFDYVGDSAPPVGWTTYTFNVQAFSGQTVLRFVADSLGAAQNIDNVTVRLCPTCTPSPVSNLGAVIDRTKAFYTTEDAAGTGSNLSGTRTLTFDGGTLRPGSPSALGSQGQPVSLALNVGSTGGTLDNAGQNIALAGSIINTASSATPFTLTGAGQGAVSSQITNLGTLVVATTGRTLFSGTINNAGGSFVLRNGGQASLTGALTGGAVSVENGQLSINSLVTAPVTVGAQGALRGTGRVAGATTIAGTLRPGNSPGTLTFTGPVTQQTGSSLVLEIDGTGTGNGAGNYSRVIVTGTGNAYTIASGVTLAPVLRGITYAAGETAGTNSYNLTLGQRLTGVIQADGGVSGTFATITQPTTAGLPTGGRIVALYNANSVDLYVGAASYAGLPGLTSNQRAAGAAVDTLESSRNPAAQPILNALIPLGIATLPSAVGGLSGEFNANLPLAAADVSRGFADMISARQGGLQGAGQGWQVWGRAFGSKARTSSDGNNPGFRHRMAGGVAGADIGVDNGARAGIAVGYADSRVTGRQDSGRASIDSYHVGGYLGWNQDALFLDAQAGVTFSSYETARVITTGTQVRGANGDTDGRSIGAGLEAGYRLDVDGIHVTPSAFLRYEGSDVDGFAEQGADVFGLTVADDKQADLRAGIGLRLVAPMSLDNGGTLVPELSARWEHDLSTPGNSTSQSLLGQTFTVQAAAPGRDTAVLGGGLSMEIADNMRLSARYDAALSDNRTQHAMTAQVRFAW